MKKTLTYVRGMLLGFAFYAITLGMDTHLSAQSLTDQMKVVESNWIDLVTTIHDAPDTYLPEVGVRGRYHAVKGLIGKKVVEGIVGEKVFLSGPHEDEMNFNNAGEFGRYNPQFLTTLRAMLTEVYANRFLVELFQPLYDRELRRYLRTYYTTFEKGTSSASLCKEYLTVIGNPGGGQSGSSFLEARLWDYSATLSDKHNYDVFEGVACTSFWVRRSIDGTANLFRGILVETLKTFDPEFLQN